MNSLELWGGHECTVNRVGDSWFDQTPRSGHDERMGDLALFADLGITSLRYPALWERISPNDPAQRDFRWTDERLGELRRLRINPIVTLCHHGSGPHYTSLIDDSFAPGLAAHAAAVAARYPWVRDWTPVNEPLTTARFSALYGLWYPHTKDEGLLWTALLNEIDATRLAMREIRQVNSAARLIQTDDLGYCHATPPLQFEADFQNERRWIGWDLLCGMVVPGHALWERLAGFGLAERLHAIADDPCPPDVIGINHYLSSERLMDHRVHLYPHRSVADRTVALCGGVPKIDVDAIRNREEGVLGLPALIEQAWQRYGRTMAITECHNGATREEQVRWFLEVWQGAEDLRARGVDLCAVTAWSLLGSYDWNRMVTRPAGHYETGVYDMRSGTSRQTLLVSVLKTLASGGKPSLPAIEGPGWWHRDARLIHAERASSPQYERAEGDGPGQALLILGSDTNLGRLAVQACEARGLAYRRCTGSIEETLDTYCPWAVFDATDLEGVCEAGGPRRRRSGSSTGISGVPTIVFTAAEPWHPYESLPGHLEIRTGSLLMPWDRSAPAVAMLETLDAGNVVEADAGKPWEAVYGPDVVDVALDLLLDGVGGAVSLRPGERLSELDFASALASVAGCDPGLVQAVGDVGPAPLFAWSAPLSYLPPLETTLERLVRECRTARVVADAAVERRDDEVRLEAAE